MFDIGFWELLLIGAVSLLVIGPEKLPEVARTVGRWVAKVQRFVAGVKADINSEFETGELRKLLGDQEDQIRELKQMVNEAKQSFESGAAEATDLAKKNLNDVKESLDSAGSNVVADASDNKSTGADKVNERIS